MTQHLKYGGSTAARTINCPAWLRLSEGMPTGDGGKNEAADTGTLLHNCMEEWLNDDPTFQTMLEEGREYNGITLTEEMVSDKLDPAVTALLALVKLTEKYFMAEPFVKIADDVGGSIDVLAKSADGKTVHIVDYKMGYVPVSAVDNAQLMFYALAADMDPSTEHFFTNCETIKLSIIQPNDDGPDLETWEVPYDALSGFEDKLFDAIEESRKPDCEPAAGSWCNYCPAHSTCPIKIGQAIAATRITDLSKMADLTQAMLMVSDLEAWIKTVKKTAHQQMENGATIDGFKLVEKRASRVWNDVPAIEGKLRRMRRILVAEAWDSKLKSPPQIEKVCKEKGIDFKEFAPYISSVSSGTTVAKASDARKAITPVSGLEALAEILN